MTEQRDIVERLEIFGRAVIMTGPVENAIKEAAAEITRLREQLRIAREALELIEAQWTPKHAAKIQEWEDYGTESFSDVDYIDAICIKPLCNIARDTLAHMDTQEKPNA